MRSDEVAAIYDDEYASTYEARWLHRGKWKHDSDFEEQMLGELLDRRVSTREKEPRWLDVACGTGYFLSRFPGVKRAGVDISPAMLSRAERANPDALFIEKRDFRDPEESWNDAWDLVTSMWWAYCYVESVADIEAVVSNLTDWTSPSGACFMPFCDIEDLTGVPDMDTHIPYLKPGVRDAPGGSLVGEVWINGFVWSWDDTEGNRLHKELITLNRGHLLELFASRFERVEVIRYPPYQGVNLRKAVLATEKRAQTLAAPSGGSNGRAKDAD